MAIEESSPVIVLLGNIDHEGILSTIKTSRYEYKKKMLDSKRENWGTIIELLKSTSVEAVVVKLTTPVFALIDEPTYDWIADQLFDAIAKKRNMIFAYSRLMDPSFEQPDEDENTDDDYDGHYYYGRRKYEVPLPQQRESLSVRLKKAGLQAIPYSSNAELTVMASQFVREVISSLLFRVYVPHGRLYAIEMDKLLQLFKDYLDRTGRRGITLNKVAAEQGVSYEFCGENAEGGDLTADFEDFSDFMNFCVTDIEKAREMLSLKSLDPQAISSIIDRYSKEARRLTIDLTHERESKIMSIRHRLESELTDVQPNLSPILIRDLVNDAVPVLDNFTKLRKQLGFGPAGNNSNITVQLNSQTIQHAHGIIANQISGNAAMNVPLQELCKFIEDNGGDQGAELINEAGQVGDMGIPESIRITKRQRIVSFLYSLGPELAKSGIHLLEQYLSSKMH